MQLKYIIELFVKLNVMVIFLLQCHSLRSFIFLLARVIRNFLCDYFEY